MQTKDGHSLHLFSCILRKPSIYTHWLGFKMLIPCYPMFHLAHYFFLFHGLRENEIKFILSEPSSCIFKEPELLFSLWNIVLWESCGLRGKHDCTGDCECFCYYSFHRSWTCSIHERYRESERSRDTEWIGWPDIIKEDTYLFPLEWNKIGNKVHRALHSIFFFLVRPSNIFPMITHER